MNIHLIYVSSHREFAVGLAETLRSKSKQIDLMEIVGTTGAFHGVNLVNTHVVIGVLPHTFETDKLETIVFKRVIDWLIVDKRRLLLVQTAPLASTLPHNLVDLWCVQFGDDYEKGLNTLRKLLDRPLLPFEQYTYQRQV